MGGFGSGSKGDRRCTDNMRALDVRQISRADLLTAGTSFSWGWTRMGKTTASINIRVQADKVVFDYRLPRSVLGGSWEAMNSEVLLDRTSCRFGGRRVWWRCPQSECGRRVAVLYAGEMFACRQCHRLAYRSQRETDEALAFRRAEAIRRRLGQC